MKNETINKKGVIGVIILITIAVLAVAGIGYFLITSNKFKGNLIPNYSGSTANDSVAPSNASPSASVAPVSNSTDLNTINTELNSTSVNSVDADFKSMNDSASSL